MNRNVVTATVRGIAIVAAAAIVNADATVIVTVTPARVRGASRDATRAGTSPEPRAVAVAVRAVAVNGGPSVVKSATAGPINIRVRGNRSNANGGPKGSSNSVPSSNRGPSNRARNKRRVSPLRRL